MALRKIPIAIGVLAAAVLSGGAAYAVTTASAGLRPDVAVSVADFTQGSATTVYLAADLNGGNEQTTAPRSPIGDPRGSALAVLRVKGNQVAFEITWQNLAAPTAAWVHAGAAGMAGAAVIPILTARMSDTRMPDTRISDTLTAVAGSVTVNNPTLLAKVVNNPGQFYLNFGDARYPSGAVRGQFHQIGPVDLQRIMHAGPLAALGSGDQEVPGTADNDARATAFLGLGTTSLSYAVSWTGLNSPTAFTVNQAAVGVNGAPAAVLFAAPGGLAPGITAVAGTVLNVPARTITAMKADPARFYTNLTTAKFPGGAARGQLFLTTPASSTPTMPTAPTNPTTAMPTQPSVPVKPTTAVSTTTMPTTTVPPQPSMPAQPSISTPAPPHW